MRIYTSQPRHAEAHRGTAQTTQQRLARISRSRAVLAFLGLCALLFALAGFGVGTTAAAGATTAATSARRVPIHALPVREEPGQNAVLKAPPSQVCIWFSEALNPATSHIVVVDPTNHEVDKGDSHVASDNNEQMCVTMQLVPAGTYVVAWRTQSAIDGHVTGGSYIFRVARPDGTVPAVPTKLPTGHFPGAGGVSSGSGTTLDGPTTLQAIGTWLAYIFLAIWLGGLIWETWILPPTGNPDPDLEAAARRSAARFASLAPYALLGILLSDVLMVLGQTAELAGSFSGMFSPALLHAVLFGSQFGTFWWGREVVALASLGVFALARRRAWGKWRDGEAATSPTAVAEQSGPLHLADWRREFVQVWRGVPRIPRRLAVGTRTRSIYGLTELLLGLALLVAFALSGHAAAVPASELGYALVVDLIHLVATAVWVGGLLYISLAFVPGLRDLDARQRARVLALGLPEFSALAIVSAVLLAVTGILNTTIHLNGPGDFLTTTYGRILAVKIELFLIMVGISFYHAFVLRPRLAAALAPTTRSADVPLLNDTGSRARLNGNADAATISRSELTSERTSARSEALSLASTHGAPASSMSPAIRVGGTGAGREASIARKSAPPSAEAQGLAQRLESWLRREAALGVGVLLCVALLAAFAGTLATTPTSASGATTAQTGPFTARQTAGTYNVSINITPDTFGTNTFTVTLTSTQSKSPVTGASVVLQTTMLDMDMGTQTVQLQAVSGTSGAYSGSSELTMAGHWQVVVKVLPPDSNSFVSTTFKFFANQG